LTSFGLKDSDTDFVLASGEWRSEPFQIPDNGFSQPIAMSGERAGLALGVEQPSKDSSEEVKFRPLAGLKLPTSGKRFLVIVLPQKGEQLRAIVIDADSSEFRPGHVMIFNFTRETLAGNLGGEKLLFRPGSQTIFQPGQQKEMANYQIQLFSSKNGEKKRFAASLWPYLEKERAFVFLYKNPRNGRLSYRSVDEFTQWIASED
jgi:hypothetical protein